MEQTNKNYPVKVTLPVQWGEMDALGHVNNVTYFRYLETGRMGVLNAIKLYRDNLIEGISTILLKIDCRYLKPVVFPDTVHIYSKVSKVGNTSITIEQEIHSDALGLVATSESVLVVFDYAKQEKTAVPDVVRETIEILNGD